VIAFATEYYTSYEHTPTRRIAEQALTGPATVIIAGIAEGMKSTWAGLVIVMIAILVAYGSAGGFHNMSLGLYGVSIAAVGMLATLGITLATDAYGPIADNAGGNAEMAGLPPEVRRRTDALDSLGNTTAATGKGFAIGSAALTALALLASYVEELKMAMMHAGQTTMEVASVQVPIISATLTQFMTHFEVHLLNPKVILGVFIGSMMSFVFCGLTINAVGRAAQSMVEEVRRQFKEKPGILRGEDKPDYARCVAISTLGAQR